jgi:hypothetical protein
VARFADAGGCDSEGYSDYSVPLCYNSLELYAVNPRTPLSGEDTSRQAVGDALCIEKYNYATSGDYYTHVDTQSSSIFTTTTGEKDYSYGDDDVTASTLDAYYDRGDSIAAFKGLSASMLWASKTGYFSVPAADFAGQCNDFNFVTFENEVEERSCDRALAIDDAALFAEQCVGSFGVSEYVNNVFLGATSDIAASANTGANFANNVVQVQISSVYFEELNNTITHNVTEEWLANDCKTRAHFSAGSYITATDNNCRFNMPGKDLTTTNLPVCQNMVKSVAYTVYHAGDAAATITSVWADVVVTDVMRETHTFTEDVNPTTGTMDYNATIGEMIKQKFSVSFRSSFTGTESDSNGNRVERSRSGNPGYIMGKPVLFGTLQAAASGETLTTIDQTVEGVQVRVLCYFGLFPPLLPFLCLSLDLLLHSLTPPGTRLTIIPPPLNQSPIDTTLTLLITIQVPSPLIDFDQNWNSDNFGFGMCPELYGTTAESAVGFGYDMSSSCKLELTRDQLAGVCCRGSSYCTSAYENVAPLYTDLTTGVPYYFSNVSAGYVGIYGNADPLDVAQWIPFSVRTSSAVRSWDSHTGICAGMLSGVKYKFLYASQGEYTYPQNKILAAEVEYITSDWYSVVPHNDTLTTQSFPLTVSVEFVPTDEQAVEGYAPPAPPVLFKVPYDVFYPFFASPAAPRAAVSALTWLAPVLCTLILVPYLR